MAWMKEPQCYKLLMDKETPTPWENEGKQFKYPKLTKDQVVLLPKREGEQLVAEGWAVLVTPKSSIERAIKEE